MNCHSLHFHQCVLIIVGDMHHRCGSPSSFSKPFYTWGNAQVMGSQSSNQLCWFAWDWGVSWDAVPLIAKPENSCPSWSPWVLSPRCRIRAQIPRLCGARVWHITEALPFRTEKHRRPGFRPELGRRRTCSELPSCWQGWCSPLADFQGRGQWLQDWGPDAQEPEAWSSIICNQAEVLALGAWWWQQ